jgi:hypothetical protein
MVVCAGALTVCSLILNLEVFASQKPRIKHADRMEGLTLVLTLALYWAVSTGMKPRNVKPSLSQKKPTDP